MAKKSFLKFFIILLIILFTVKGIQEFYGQNPELLFDNILTVLLLFILLFQYHKWKFNKASMYSAILALGLHHSKLYGTVWYAIPFDRIMHFIGAFALALFVYQMLKPYHKSLFNIAFYTILISIGMGTLIEHSEFVGYSTIGEGKGILGYGDGDWGEWNNISWDLICNTMGALCAAVLCMLNHKPSKKWLAS